MKTLIPLALTFVSVAVSIAHAETGRPIKPITEVDHPYGYVQALVASNDPAVKLELDQIDHGTNEITDEIRASARRLTTHTVKE